MELNDQHKRVAEAARERIRYIISGEVVKEPFHLLRCAGELGVMAVRELYATAGEAIDAAWPADSEEDAEIRSDIWERGRE